MNDNTVLIPELKSAMNITQKDLAKLLKKQMFEIVKGASKKEK